ncbi:MAG: alpha/beta hydrolase [bacterium]|nr:alpha/beta hydrolase [bacterium]
MRIIINGLAIEYDDRGSGETIVMLHGWKDNLRTFDGIFTALATSFRVIRIDLPGFGGSDAPPKDWTLEDYVSFVKDFTDKLNITPSAYAGHSFGGRIVIHGVASKVLNAKKIILISSAGVARRKTLKNSGLAVLAKFGRAAASVPPLSFWKQSIRRKLYESIGSDYFRAGALSGTFLNIIKKDLAEDAKKISLPTLLIWGSNDMATPLEEGERLHSLIRNSTLHVIPGAGHFVHQERPAEISGIIRKFLS